MPALFKFLRAPLSLALSFTGFCAHNAACGRWQGSSLLTWAGLFCLAGGAAALNQLQERETDAVMARTKRRSALLARFGGFHSAATVALSLCAGVALLWLSSILSAGQALPVLLFSLLSLVLYNVGYTLLKGRTVWSIVPGVLNGASPVLIGWLAGGGALDAPGLWLLFGFMLLWQVPHFMLLLFKEGEDYQKAGLKVLSSLVSRRQLGRITFIWILAAGLCAALFPLYGLVRSGSQFGIIAFSVIFITVLFRRLLDPFWHALDTRAAFLLFNGFGLAVFSAVLAEALF